MLARWEHRLWALMRLAAVTTPPCDSSRWTPATTLYFTRRHRRSRTTRSGPSAWKPPRILGNCSAASTCHRRRTCRIGHDNGSFYITGSTDNWPANAVAGEDLKVLVARVTTCSDFSIQVCIQVFVGKPRQRSRRAPRAAACVAPGCTEPDACNYNPSATTDDGTCLTMAFTDATESASPTRTAMAFAPKRVGWMHGCRGNFDASATDDGTCEYETCAGCANCNACTLIPKRPSKTAHAFREILHDAIALTRATSFRQIVNVWATAATTPTPATTPRRASATKACVQHHALRHHRKRGAFSQNIQDYTYTNTTGSFTSGSPRAATLSVPRRQRGVGGLERGRQRPDLVLETNADGCSGEEVCFDVNITLTSVDELLEGTLTCSQCQPERLAGGDRFHRDNASLSFVMRRAGTF